MSPLLLAAMAAQHIYDLRTEAAEYRLYRQAVADRRCPAVQVPQPTTVHRAR